jgi:hypothetical protein
MLHKYKTCCLGPWWSLVLGGVFTWPSMAQLHLKNLTQHVVHRESMASLALVVEA